MRVLPPRRLAATGRDRRCGQKWAQGAILRTVEHTSGSGCSILLTIGLDRSHMSNVRLPAARPARTPDGPVAGRVSPPRGELTLLWRQHMGSARLMRLGATVGLLALGGAALTACSSSDNGGAAQGGSGDPVTISYGIWDPNQAPAMKEIAKAFEAKNTNITVDVQVTPGQQFFTKLQ